MNNTPKSVFDNFSFSGNRLSEGIFKRENKMEHVALGFVDVARGLDQVNFEQNDRNIKIYNTVNQNANDIGIMKGRCLLQTNTTLILWK